MIQYGVDFNDSWAPTVPTSNFHPRNPSAPAGVLHNQRDIATSPYVVACFDPDLWLATRVMFTLTFKLDETSDTSKTPGTANLDCETGRYLRNGLKVWRKVNFIGRFDLLNSKLQKTAQHLVWQNSKTICRMTDYSPVATAPKSQTFAGRSLREEEKVWKKIFILLFFARSSASHWNRCRLPEKQDGTRSIIFT